MSILGTLAQTHASARKSLGEDSLSKNDGLNAEFMNESGTFNFGNLS